jgi:hypothetical protein
MTSLEYRILGKLRRDLDEIRMELNRIVANHTYDGVPDPILLAQDIAFEVGQRIAEVESWIDDMRGPTGE